MDPSLGSRCSGQLLRYQTGFNINLCFSANPVKLAWVSLALTATQMLLAPETIRVLLGLEQWGYKTSCPRKTEVFLRNFSQFSLPMEQDNDWTNQLALLPRWMWSTGIVERITLRSQCSHAEFILYSPEARRGRRKKKKICDLLTLWSSEVFVNHNFPDMKDLLGRAEK